MSIDDVLLEIDTLKTSFDNSKKHCARVGDYQGALYGQIGVGICINLKSTFENRYAEEKTP